MLGTGGKSPPIPSTATRIGGGDASDIEPQAKKKKAFIKDA
jgi:hypothetical protein